MMYVKLDAAGNIDSAPILRSNLEYILSPEEFTPEGLRAKGFAEIKNWVEPPIQVWEEIRRGDIVKNASGEVEQLWIRNEISVDEKVRRWILGPRDNRLMMTDWTQLTDAPISAEEKSQWAQYRQALRDLTKTLNLAALKGPEQIQWPTPPGNVVNMKWMNATGTGPGSVGVTLMGR